MPLREGERYYIGCLLAIVIGYSYLSGPGADFMPADPMFIDIWFGMMALLGCSAVCLCLHQFCGMGVYEASPARFKAKKGDGRSRGSHASGTQLGKTGGKRPCRLGFLQFHLMALPMGVRQFEVKHLTVYVPDLPEGV